MFGRSRQLAKLRNLKLGQQCSICYSTEASEFPAAEKQAWSRAESTYGQPVHRTHPHLVKPDELTPGIELREYKSRRDALMRKINESRPNAENLVVITSASRQFMSEKIPYVFRQNTDFRYFSGCLEPDSAVVLHGHENGEYDAVMFMRPKDEQAEIWEGPRTGFEAAKDLFGVDDAMHSTEFSNYCVNFLQRDPKAMIWYEMAPPYQPYFHGKMKAMMAAGKSVFASPRRMMHDIRLIKSASELALLRKACDITSEAIKKTIRVAQPGMSEHQLFATVDYHCRMDGADILGYPPVVAAGNNATTIHYTNNNQIIKDGDMVLMDVGSEYRGYTADITRTWPANGKFSQLQTVLYEIVLEIQEALIEQLSQMPSLDEVFRNMCNMLGNKLCAEGVVSKQHQKRQSFYVGYKFCSHHAGHYLGMDVHDTGTVTRDVPVRPGMVVTIEPGIYVSAKNDLARPEFHGLGVRIEDDILITESGPVVLSKGCPKSVREIEELASENNA